MAQLQLSSQSPFVLTVNGTINDAGEIIADLTSTVGGAIAATTLSASGATTLSTTLAVAGASTLHAVTATTVHATGAATLDSTLNVTGLVTAANVTATGTVDVSASAKIRLPAANALNQYSLQINLKDIIGANGATGYVVVPLGGAGTIQQIDVVLDNTTATGSLVLTASIGATPVTGGVVTILSGVAAGTAATPAVPSAANTVAAGDVLKIVPSGTQDAAGTGMVTLSMRRTVPA